MRRNVNRNVFNDRKNVSVTKDALTSHLSFPHGSQPEYEDIIGDYIFDVVCFEIN